MSDNGNRTDEGSVEFRRAEIQTITSNLMDQKFKGWKKTGLFFGATFLLVMAAMIAIGTWYIADLAKAILVVTDAANATQQSTITIERNGLLSADYLAAVIPLLLALGGTFIAFLGMNRLKMFDERIDQTRSEMLKEIESKVKSEVAIDRIAFSKQIIKDIEYEQRKFDDAVKRAETGITAQKDKYITEIDKQFSSFDSKYTWLQATIEHKEADLNFYTVDDAHKLTEQLRSIKPDGYVDIIRKIVNRVCDGGIGISGDAADYHNLAAELARGSMYNEACKVLQRGLTFFESDADMLSDLIEYATKGGMLEDAKQAVQKLDSMNPRLWTWRCYEFVCDYYRAIGDLEMADKLCDKFIQAFPNDEHGYRSKAEVIRSLYPGEKGIEESIVILENAIAASINCPQCANALAETYLSLGRYGDALLAANRAVLELAQQQPHINISYVFYNRATIQDRMFMRKLDDRPLEQPLVDAAYEDYRMALSLGKLSPIVGRQALVRMNILERYVTPELVMPSKDNDDPHKLLELLQALKSTADSSQSD